MGRSIDPHTFEITPGVARTASEADVVLVNGIGLDDFLLDDIEGANGEVRIVTVTDGIELIEGGHEHEDEDEHEGEAEDEHDEDDEDHEEGGFDAHVWQDPLRVKVMVANIAAALAEVDPDNADDYQANAEAYQHTLDETHAEIQALIDEIPQESRKLVTNHEALTYFADRYGFEIVGTVIPGTSTEADPSAGELAELSELIEHESVRAIFTEQLVDPRVAEQLASDTGVEIVYDLYTDSIGEPGSPGETLHGMLLENARLISEALR
jgi:ABC-type Zn uptake system ZnuABC Zn-binding protein ZnuA